MIITFKYLEQVLNVNLFVVEKLMWIVQIFLTCWKTFCSSLTSNVLTWANKFSSSILHKCNCYLRTYCIAYNISRVKIFMDSWVLSIFVINILRIAKRLYRIVMQDKIFKVKIFEVIQKSSKSMKIFSLKIFRLYGISCIYRFHVYQEQWSPITGGWLECRSNGTNVRMNVS